MTKTKALLVFLALITCFSLGWSATQGNDNDIDRGIGGTGKYNDDIDRGLGGTGKQNEDIDRGLGGTGIIGTITNFGSIWVNGIEVELNQQTQLKIDGMTATESDLRLGQQVKVLAEQEGDTWFAKTVLIDHAVIGRIDKLLENGFVVQGMVIHQDPTIPGEWPTLAVNDYVKVSGYFNHGQFYATDVMPTGNEDSWQITAPVVYQPTSGWQIAGQALPDAILEAREGQMITLRGKYTQKGRELTFIRYEASVPFDGQSKKYIVENRGSKTDRNRSYSRDDFEKKQRNINGSFFERSPIMGPGKFSGNPPPPFNGSWGKGSWKNTSGWNRSWQSNQTNTSWKGNDWQGDWESHGWDNSGDVSNKDFGSFSGSSNSRGMDSSRSRGPSSGGPSRGGPSGGKW